MRGMRIAVLRRLTTIAVLLSFVVVLLGAYTRLTDAGLGCPDWPGCYGHWVVHATQTHAAVVAPTPIETLSQATLSQYRIHTTSMVQPAQPLHIVETQKAWTEMIHRYAAGTVALLIFLITMQWARQPTWGRGQTLLPPLLAGLVIFQALLGMWTVTWRLLPLIVMLHLVGGILIFSGLMCLRWHMGRYVQHGTNVTVLPYIGILHCHGAHRLIMMAWSILLLQIALGGWVSANYAGLACIGFPRCNGQWFPALHFSEGFDVWHPVGENYQGGLLESAARVTIQWVHRMGAVVTSVVLLSVMGIALYSTRHRVTRCLAWSIIYLVCLQFFLGIMNVLFQLPLMNAVLHNGVAALLMAMLSCLWYGVAQCQRIALNTIKRHRHG